MAKSLIRKNQLHPDISDLVGQYGSGFFITSGDLDSFQFIPELTSDNVVFTTGNQTISGSKNFTTRPTLSGLNLITTGDLVDLELQILGLENAQIINQTNNFSISGNGYGKVITANSSVLITGSIMGGNAIGFNTSIIQVGPGQIQITGDGIKIDSYNNQYRTAGPFATISLLHTGNNGYIMYGNTSS